MLLFLIPVTNMIPVTNILQVAVSSMHLEPFELRMSDIAGQALSGTGMTVLSAIVAIAYLLLVRSVRYRRAARLPSKHSINSRQDYHKLTADQAQVVLKDLVELEFPKSMGFSVVFALFKTYGIPSISSLLIETGELSNPDTTSKRIADTGILILEFCLNKPSSPRALEAVARMNYLHRSYIKAGRIRNAYMLYTLSVFALEPIRWVNRFEWRCFTDFELCATGTFWKSMGDRMEIDMSVLPGADRGWRDGTEWLHAIEEWSEAYEKAKMIPHVLNHKLVTANLDVIFLNVPVRLRNWGGHIVSVVAGARLRDAVMLAKPPTWFEVLLVGSMTMRKYAIRYLAIPRISRKTYLHDQPHRNGRYSAKEYLSHPWYVEPTLMRRWAPTAWFTWIIGRKLPGDEGGKYKPDGYLISEVGPRRTIARGGRFAEAEVQRMKSMRSGGCPFGKL